MKLLSILLILCLLSGCGAPAASEQVSSVQEPSPLSSVQLEVQGLFYIVSRGGKIIAMTYGQNNTAPGFYTITTEPLACQWDAALVAGMDCLWDIDGTGGIWVSGHSSEGNGQALRLDDQGNVTLTCDFGPESSGYSGVFSFTWDTQYYYFLVSFDRISQDHPYEAALIVFDHQGTQVAQESLTAYSTATLGYLDVEADWMEDLEGREDDALLKMLFPAGPTDSLQLTRLADGTPTLIVQRHAPIGDEVWDVVCPIDPADFSVTPQGAYPVPVRDGIVLDILVESAFPEYSLLVAQYQGLYGYSLPENELTLLADWDTIGFPMTRYAPNNSHTIASCPDGIVLQLTRPLPDNSATASYIDLLPLGESVKTPIS